MTSVSPESSSLKSAPSLLAFLAGRPGRRPVGTLAAFLATGPAAAVLVAALAADFAAVDVVAAFLATALDATVLEIGRAHACTPVTNAQLVCRLLLDKKTLQD